MRKALITLLGAIMVCSLVFADEGKTEMKTEKKMSGKAKSEILNNVIKMDKDGNRTALCGCGKEFSVTDQSPTVVNGDMTMYCCSQACHDKASSASKEESMKMMKDWRHKFMGEKLVNNVYMKDGKMMATCVCGKTVEVDPKKTPHVTENGVTMYLCSDACESQLHGMSAADRLDKEKGVLAAAMAPAQAAAPTTPAAPAGK